MSPAPEPIIRWLEQKRRSEQTTAAVLAVLALAGGAAVFLVIAFLIFLFLFIVCGAFLHSVPWLGLAAFGLTVGFFARHIQPVQEGPERGLDPMGFWVIRDICLIGPRLTREGLQQIRRCGQLAELDVAVCAQALACLATQNVAVAWEELIRHCPHTTSARLRENLSILDGVLFLGEDASRVLLMEPFRRRLRSMLDWETRTGKRQEPARPGPGLHPPGVRVIAPEMLSPYEILGLSPLASLAEIKKAYRKRMKECHPDLYAGMDEQTRALAEGWARALNTAYATLNPRRRDGARPVATWQR